MNLQLSKYTKYTVEIGIVLLIIAVVSYSFIYLLRYLSGILLPLAVIYLFSVVIRLPYRWLKRTCGYESNFWPFTIVAIGSILSIVIVLSVFGQIFLSQFKLLTEFIGETDRFPQLIESIKNYIPLDDILKRVANNERLGLFLNPDLLGSISRYIFGTLSALGDATFSSAMALITWIVIPSFVYSLVTQPLSNLEFSNLFPFLDKKTRGAIASINTRYNLKLEKYFTKQFLQSILEIVIVSALFYAFGFKAAFAVAVIVGILNLIPNFGTLFLLLTSWSIAFLNPDEAWGYSFVVTLLIALFILFLDNLLLPRVIDLLFKRKSDWRTSTDVNNSVMTVSIIFWGYVLDGLLGLVLSVPITLMVLVLIKHFEVENPNKPTKKVVKQTAALDAEGAGRY